MKSLTFYLAVLISILTFQSCSAKRKTEVMVLGTIHELHKTNSNYSYNHINAILKAYQPDVICVEIRPDDFETKPYLKEMMLATIFGKEHNIPVFPIDWWTENMQKQAFEAFQTSAYKEKERLLDSLMATNNIIRNFESEYDVYPIILKDNPSWKFINDTVFNNFICERNKLALEVMKDGPETMFMNTRNRKMVERIHKVINKNRGKRIIVLTGGEHKYFFDKELTKDKNIYVVSPVSINPDLKVIMSNNVNALINQDIYDAYYSETYLNDPARFFGDKIIPLLHGPNMDFEPQKVPDSNLIIAEGILKKWGEKDTLSVDYIAELAWFNLLKGNYSLALDLYSGIDKRIDVPACDNQLIALMLYRNMGICFDMLQKREKAVAIYIKGEESLKGFRAKLIKKYLFKNYKEVPFSIKKERP